MKRYLIILVTFCGLFSSVYGQSPSAAIDSLVKYKVITGKERLVLEKELRANKHYDSYRVAILGGLTDIMLQKTFHINLHKTGIFYSYSKGYLNNKTRKDSTIRSLRILLGKIKKANLLTDRVYTYTLNGIDTGHFVADVQLMGHLAEMSYRLEGLSPDKLLPLAHLLHKNNIISDSSFLQLKNDISHGKIESAFQLNDYCKLDHIFDMTKYPDDPDVWLEQLHHDIASMLPGVTFSNFSYTTIPDTSYTIPGARFKVSLTCNGRIYQHTSLAINTFRKQEKISPKDIVAADFYRIFNKILIDQQSPLQLHSIMYTNAAGDNLRHHALIALNEEQAGVFMQKSAYSFMLISMDEYDSRLTSARVDSATAGWRNMGLFAHLSSAEISKAIDDVQADNLFSINSLLKNFPDVLYSLNDSWDNPHPPRYPYADLLSNFAKITRSKFTPQQITQQKVKGGIKLQYLSGAKVHSYTFRTANGWMDAQFPAFMKHLARENNLQGNFYHLPYENAVIYLTKQQYDDAVKYSLLDFETTTPQKL
jgi:hypothetical protein